VAARGSTSLSLDLRPQVKIEALTKRLASAAPGQSTTNRLRKAAHMDPLSINLMREGFGASLPTSAEALAGLIKAAPLKVTGVQGLERAISSAGGVALSELDDRLMLRSAPGVFCAGEMLDWEAPTGGYLLQASFATGWAAAGGVTDWLAAR
jgi:predicted flavoprotein YhiN